MTFNDLQGHSRYQMAFFV